MSAAHIEITELGAQGDGVAAIGGDPVYVPFTGPGDKISAAVEGERGTLLSVLEPGPHRVAPPCPHFGPNGENARCGGCAVQHIGHAFYTDWKRDLVAAALASRAIETDVSPLVRAQPGDRRRVVFAAIRDGQGVRLGFHRAGSHDIIAIDECLIAAPRIIASLPLFRRLAAHAAVKSKGFHMAVLDTTSGFDVAFDAPFALAENDRLRLVAATRKIPEIARISHNGETLFESRAPQLEFGPVTVSPPPGAFVQASAAAENAMAEIVLKHMSKAKRVIDLYAGCGTFATRLSKSHIVHAVESHAPSLAALDRGMRRVQGLKPVTIETRDLVRRPLMTAELKNYQGLVFDPPRAGAEVQVRQIAKSTVKFIAAVSCNPATLARDVRLLMDGGYKLKSVTPIDQFLYTPHVEAVALLIR